MGHGLILSIDCGTQSIRALLFDDKGNLIAKEKREFEPYYSNYPGWAEQDTKVYWESCCDVCQKVKQKNPDEWDRIMGVTVTTQRDTCVVVDRDGNPLRPAIIWLDQRMAACSEPLPVLNNIAFSAVGMQRTVNMTRKKSKANWIRENEPDIWNKTYKFLLLSGFFTMKLTGKFIDSAASQIGHIPFDHKNRNWPKSKKDYRWSVFGIEKDKLPDLVEPGVTIAYITEEASNLTGIKQGLPLIASGSDKGCETLGVGCVDRHTASLSFGTTATIQVASDFYFEPIRFMPSYIAALPGFYNPEIEIFRGYWMISWFKQEFAVREMIEAERTGVSPEELLNARLKEIPPGSQGLILTPYWGPGLKMPEAKGSIIGFGDVHTRAHIYRAIIEGINYALLEGMEDIEKRSGNKIKVKKLMASGGGSQSDTICQITSDMFNLPVYKGQTHETSGLGAAINGFIGMGVYKTYKEAADNMVHYSKKFTPNKECVGVYKHLYSRVYKKVYPKLKCLYKEIQCVTNYPEL